MIRIAKPDDAEQICSIYNYYIEKTTATFEEKPVTIFEMKNRIITITKTLPWIVLEENDQVIGYAYASPWNKRPAYRFSVESTVYISNENIGKGRGIKIYKSLLAELVKIDIHSVMGCIALPNERSKRLHENLGFKKSAHFSEVGFKFDKWLDVGYWELIL